MKKRVIMRVLAVLMVISLCVPSVTSHAVASDFKNVFFGEKKQEGNEVQHKKVKKGKKERVYNKTKNSTTFLNEDGSKELVMYGSDVRFENEEGLLTDYDPSLVEITTKDIKTNKKLKKYKYQNNQGDKKHYLPESLTEETPILMQNDSYEIMFRPVFAGDDLEAAALEDDASIIQAKNLNVSRIEDNDNQIEQILEDVNLDVIPEATDLEKADLSDENVIDIYEDNQELPTKITYTTDDEAMQLEYISQDNGIKENIILHEKPESNVFLFELSLKDMFPRNNIVDGGITFYDNKTEDIVGGIAAPFMNDASGKAYSEDVTYTIGKKSEEDDTYILAVTVDQAYLDSEERVYPVTIDPTATWYGSEEIHDVYVINRSPYLDTNFYSTGTVTSSVGEGAQGVFRTYFRFEDFTKTIDNYYISSAKLTLYETGTAGSGGTIQAHRVTEDWSKASITWNNRPSYASSIYDSFQSTGVKGTRTLDLTEHARQIANGTYKSYGIMLRDADESSTGVYSKFYSSRCTTESYRPKLTIVYYDGPSTASSVTVNDSVVKPGLTTTVSWEGITSQALDRVEYRVAYYDCAAGQARDTWINYSSETKIGTTSSGSYRVPGSASWPTGCYRLYVRGVDKGGIKGTGLGVNVHIDGTVPTLSSAKITLPTTTTSSTKYSNVVPTIQWSASDEHFQQIEYSINKINYGAFQGPDASKPETAVLKSKTGSYTLPSSYFTAAGAYVIKIRARDKADNYSSVITLPTYYYDKTAPVITNTKITTPSSSTTPSTDATPSFTYTTNDISLSKVEYSINDGGFTAVTTSTPGTFTLPAGKLVTSGTYSFKFRAVDTAGNCSTVTSPIYYYYENPNQTAENYAPILSVQGIYGYKNHISWTRKTSAALPSNVNYEVHRSTTAGFTPSPATLVASGLRSDYWVDPNVNDTATVYYKVRSVIIENGKPICFSGFVGASYLNNNKENVTKRIGFKEHLGYLPVGTPNGSGSIEKSLGNVIYQQSDITLTNSQLPITLQRTYNSTVKGIGMFGLGWDFSLNLELMKQKDAAGKTEYLWKNQSGALHRFIVNADGSYTSNAAKDFKLVVEVDTFEAVAEEGANKVTYKVNSNYTLTSKDNTVYKFDASGRIVFITEPNGNFNLFEYDQTKGRLINIVSNNKQSLSFLYSSNGITVSEIKLPDGTSLKYGYDSSYRLTSVTRTNGINQVVYGYEYDTITGYLTKILDAEKNPYGLVYAGEKAVKFTYPNGDALNLMYDTANKKTIISKTNNVGNQLYQEYMVYDGATGYILQECDASGNITSYTYQNDLDLLVSTSRNVDYQQIENNKIELKTETLTTSTQYNENHNVISETDEEGNKTSYEYDSSSETSNDFPTGISETTASGTTVSDESYIYDENGNVIETADSVEKTKSSIEYDEDGNASDYTDETNGLVANDETYTYDSNGNLIQSESVSGTVSIKTENTYDAMGQIKSSKEIDGATNKVIMETYYEYDFMGRLIKTSYVINGITETETKDYYPNGTLKKEVSRDGITTTYQYDNMNRLVSRTLSKGTISITYSVSYTYEDVTIHTGDGKDKTIKNAYLETERNKEGAITYQKYYNGHGELVREKKNGIYTDYTYDNQGKVITTFMIGTNENDISQGKLTINLYDKAGNCIYTIINPLYDNIEDKYIVDEENTIVVASTYDSQGNVLTKTDALNHKSEFQYDALSRLTKVIMPDGTETGHTTQYDYDLVNANNTITTQVSDTLGQISQSIENAAGQTIAIKDVGDDSNAIQTKMEYDTQGNKVKEIYNNGDYKTFEYDAKNRLVKKSSYRKDGTKESVIAYTYDIANNKKTMIDYEVVNGVETQYRYTWYEYDAMNRLIGTSEVNGNQIPSTDAIQANKIAYTYDIEGYLVAVTYPAFEQKVRQLTFTYNSDKWLTQIKAMVSNGTSLEEHIVREYVYHNDGKVKEIKDYYDYVTGSTNYLSKRYDYDVFDRTSKMNYTKSSDLAKVVESYEYTYDKNSNILSEKLYRNYDSGSVAKVNETREYTYDELGRLINTKITDHLQATSKISNTSYTYDKVGNRIKMVVNDTTTEYTYNKLNQLLSSISKKKDSTTGVETIVSSIVYTYDANGNQIQEVDSVTKEKTTQQYDVNNRLVKLEKKNESTILLTQTNDYNGDGQRISKTENNITTNYFYQDGVVVYTTDGYGIPTSFNVIGQSDNIIATKRYTGTDVDNYYLYCKDIKGSTTSLIDQTGQAVLGYSYDDFGKTMVTGESAIHNEVCYTGGIYDASTKLYYLNARYYNPANGSFLTQDTYRGTYDAPETLHLYAYCANNPIAYVDPSGHAEVAIPVGVKVGVDVVVGWLVTLGVIVVGGVVIDYCISSTADYTWARKEKIYAANPRYRIKASEDVKQIRNEKIKSKSKAKSGKDSKVTRGKSKAPKQGQSDSLYEQVDNNGKVMSRTKYGKNQKPEFRQDYNHPHYSKELGKYLKPHQHNYTYNSKGQPNGDFVTVIK